MGEMGKNEGQGRWEVRGGREERDARTRRKDLDGNGNQRERTRSETRNDGLDNASVLSIQNAVCTS
jgi:hypothetical protein